MGPLAEICAEIMLELMVDLITYDLQDGKFDTPDQVRTAAVSTHSVFTNNPLAPYRDNELGKTLQAQVDPGKYAPDMTRWLVSTMNKNAGGPVAKLLRNLNAGSIADQVTALIAWTALVKGNGPWDFKVEFNNYQTRYVIFGGIIFRMDVVANIHYGFVGAASGFPLKLLLLGAGAAQIMDNGIDWSLWESYFDDPLDANAVILGYSLYEQYGANMTVEQFITTIQQYQVLLSKDYPQPK